MRIHRLFVLLLASILVLGAPSALAGEGNKKNDDAAATGEDCRDHGPDKDTPGKGHGRSCDDETDEGTTSSPEGGTEGDTDEGDEGRGGKDHPHGGPPGHDPASEQPSGGSPKSPPAGNGQPPGQTIPGTFDLSVDVDQVVAQVGSTLTYEITLTNTASQAAAATVQNVIPDEVDLVSASNAPTVAGGTIQWSLTDLAAGSVTTLTWTGRVAREGDLDAVNLVTLATTGAQDVTAETHTYLATVQGLRLQRSAAEPDWGTHQERRVVFRAAGPHTETAGASTSGSAQLPQTGFPALELGFIAALLMLGGLVLLGRGKRVAAAAMMVVLVMAACTSENPAETPTDDRNEAAEDEKDDDEVLGTRVSKDDKEDEKEDGAGEDDGTATDDSGDPEETDEDSDDTRDEAAEDPAADEGDELVKDVVLVEVANEAPDPDLLGSASGHNTVSLTWNEATRSIGTATSSRFFQSGPIDLLSSISDAGNGIGTNVSLTNITDDERLLVRGHLVLTVTGAGGSIVELTSPAIDTVLDPHDEISTDFVLALPTGSYVIDSSFVAS